VAVDASLLLFFPGEFGSYRFVRVELPVTGWVVALKAEVKPVLQGFFASKEVPVFAVHVVTGGTGQVSVGGRERGRNRDTLGVDDFALGGVNHRATLGVALKAKLVVRSGVTDATALGGESLIGSCYPHYCR
jgi:hypothetical protein